jgi:hypothetical protein
MDGDSGKKTFKTYYLDDDHNIIDSEKATQIVVNVYDENGNMIEEKWGIIRKPGVRPNYNETEIEMTPEMGEVLRNVKDMHGNYLFRESVDKELAGQKTPKRKKQIFQKAVWPKRWWRQFLVQMQILMTSLAEKEGMIRMRGGQVDWGEGDNPKKTDVTLSP